MASKNAANTTSAPAVSTSNAIGIFGAILILINSVVGIGIYFKNGGVLRSNGNNPWGVLGAWVIGFFIIMCVILTLSEVLSAKVSNKQMNDLGDWHRVFSGRRLGLFFKVFVPLIYYTFLFFIVSIFASEAFLSILGVGHGDTHIYIVFIVSFVFMLIISCIHVFSEKFGVAFGKYGTFIKYVPILFLILIAVLASIVAPDKSYFASSATESREFSFTGMLSSLPAILFAFDGFMVVGSVSKRIKNSSKSLPIILSVGILIVGLTYLTITICQLISGSATIIEAFNNLFPEEFHGSLERIFGVFLFIAAISSLNAIGLGSVNYLENIIDDNLLVGSVLVRKITKCKKNMSGVVATWVMVLFYFAVAGIPSIIMNTDEIVDLASNCVTFVIFIGFGLLAIFVLINRFVKTHHHIPTSNRWFGIPIAIIATIGMIAAVGYVSFYTYLARAITQGSSPTPEIGIFFDGNPHITILTASIIYWVTMFVFVAIPVINNIIMDLRYNRFAVKKDIEETENEQDDFVAAHASKTAKAKVKK